MRMASSFSILPDTDGAAREGITRLTSDLGAAPDLIVLYATEHHASPSLIEIIRNAFPGVPVIGGTSCGGVMTERGFHSGSNGAIGFLGISDQEGSYGVGAEPLGDDARAAGAAAVGKALAGAGRDFEAPALIWCCQPPGCEERVIEGIQSVVGASVPIIGGSAADETIGGAWRQFTHDGVLQDHAVVAVLLPTLEHGAAFQSGYAPTEHGGRVTRASGRRVIEIDGEPAAQVYSRWTDGEITADQPGTILAKSTPTPLGRVAGTLNNMPMFVLSHPALIGAGGDLSLFTDVAEGDQIHMMRGSAASLVKRAGIVVNDARANGGWEPGRTAGGLVIYCGGCMLHVRERMEEVADEIVAAMDNAPFLCAFTFGEQGAIIDSCNRHGNLMISALAFGQ